MIIEKKEIIDFPAVTICNLNRMKLKYVPCLYNLTKLCPLFSEYGRSDSISLPERRSIHSRKREFRGKILNNRDASIEFLHLYSQLNNIKRKIFGHHSPDMIKTCLFNGRQNNIDFESFVSFRYGNCFTLKPEGVYFKKPWKGTSAESGNALELVLNVEPDEYVPISHTIGMRIEIHNPKDIPDPERNGFNIFPGYENHITFSQTIIGRLPFPYKDKCISYADN
ncbi:amiloride-sensitive sodium channel subunit alpha [Caerostris darwini]|uniref:Amiloride-sensitive sodium channel subunit alpha n=1 Tax=Caerostris darwini TaxID=1538125 RepID=A0AAV4VB87_9ARAC|nr:amiloride-sensitive sodium channel subunit alpha [Caerostris darwini]